MDIYINVANDFTKTPGGRFAKDGEYSGEDFRIKILKPKFLEWTKNPGKFYVDLDGGFGYTTSFLDEAFGGLARETKNILVNNIVFKSNDEPSLIDEIKRYINKGLEK